LIIYEILNSFFIWCLHLNKKLIDKSWGMARQPVIINIYDMVSVFVNKNYS
jgi:hypothetical protein